MAVRYAVANGNWSSTSTWNGGTLPTSADDVYANNFTVVIDQNIAVLSLRNTAQSPAVAGGGFTLNSGITVNCTGSGILGVGTTPCVTYSGSGTAVIYSNISDPGTSNSSTLLMSGTGTLTINGNLTAIFSNSITSYVVRYNSGILNINGNVSSGSVANNRCLLVAGTGTVTIVGDINSGNQALAVSIQSNATINITGTVRGDTSNANSASGIQADSVCTINHTGNVIATNGAGYLLNQPCTLNITGTVNGGTFINRFFAGVNNASTAYVKIVGSLIANYYCALVSSNTSAINICTGPFVSSDAGIMPFYALRMHYQKTLGSYFEFRDSSTNGALPPSAAAPATRLVSPDTVVDSPIPANVRNGVSYALGTFTGTLKVPNPNSVAYGVETDNTVGNAVLTPNAVWNHLISNITTSNSIGERLKNASTVETTGDQLAALI